MKKILHIQIIPKLTGVQKISLEIFKALNDNLYKKYMLCSSQCDIDNKSKDDFINEFENANVKIIKSPNLIRNISLRSDIKAFMEIYKLCRKEKFDIVHTHSTKPGIIGRIAARLAGVPLVVHTVHGVAFHKYEIFVKRILYYLFEVFSSFFSHKITLVNKYYLRYYKFIKNRTTVIYNGINFNDFSPFTKDFDKKDKIIKVLFIGRLDRPKDPVTLLNTARIIINEREFKHIFFTFVGDGELWEECIRFVENHKLSRYVNFTGWKNELSEYYQTHDIFCLPSIYESFGLIFLEAGFYSLPTVSTNVEGIPEVVINDKTGILVPPKQPDALAEKICFLSENIKLRKTMGTNAKKWVENSFHSSRMTNSYISLYEQKLKNKTFLYYAFAVFFTT